MKNNGLSLLMLFVLLCAGCVNPKPNDSKSIMELSILKKMNIGSCMDAALSQELLFVIGIGTGIAVSGSIAAITNRQYGVEFADISKPEKPAFPGMVRSGEAQSVFLKDTLAVIGDWGTKEVVLTDMAMEFL